jgi:glyoxylase-like metal-dependent hydrolase (beta-lactamase superfamily II)
MPDKHRWLGVVILAVGLSLPAGLDAQHSATTLESAQRARRVLDEALAATGGERLRAVRTILVRHEGVNLNRNQSRRVAAPYDTTPNRGTLALDLAGGRFAWDLETGYPGGFHNWNRIVVTSSQGWSANPLERRWFTLQANIPTLRQNLSRRLPHAILLEAADRAQTLRWLGSADHEGRPQDVLAYATADGQQLSIYIDRSTHLLTKVEQAFTDPLTGDALFEMLASEYRNVGGIQIPAHRVLRRAGEIAEDVRFTDIRVDEPLADSLFSKPAEYVDGTGGPIPDTTVMAVGDGVHLVRGVAGGNNTLVVVFEEYVLAMEPYGGEADSRRTLARIREIAPGKPLRYIAVTHHHDDHSGGLRAWIAEGAAVVTTPGNRGYFSQMAKAPYTLSPDRQQDVRAPLRLELVEGAKRVFTDGRRTLELYNIGPSPHADEMLVAYLPAERAIFQGDLLNRPADGRARAGNLTTAHFLEWLERSGLAVDRVLGVHGPPATLEELRTAVRMFREAN